MYCPKCNFKVEPDALFCGNCGAKIENNNDGPDQNIPVYDNKKDGEIVWHDDVASDDNKIGYDDPFGGDKYGGSVPDDKPVRYEPAEDNGGSVSGNYPTGGTDSFKPRPEKKGNKTVPILVAVIVVLVIAIGVGAFYILKDKKGSGEDPNATTKVSTVDKEDETGNNSGSESETQDSDNKYSEAETTEAAGEPDYGTWQIINSCSVLVRDETGRVSESVKNNFANYISQITNGHSMDVVMVFSDEPYSTERATSLLRELSSRENGIIITVDSTKVSIATTGYASFVMYDSRVKEATTVGSISDAHDEMYSVCNKIKNYFVDAEDKLWPYYNYGLTKVNATYTVNVGAGHHLMLRKDPYVNGSYKDSGNNILASISNGAKVNVLYGYNGWGYVEMVDTGSGGAVVSGWASFEFLS